jgi:serine protease Do
VAESIGLGKPIGAMVSSVEAGGPADKAGVEAGDIITRVDGRPVEKYGDLPRMVGMTRPGAKTSLQIFRRGTLRDIGVVVAEFEPERAASASGRDAAKPPAAAGTLGLSVADLTDGQRRELKVKSGVRVEAVEGAAARAGVREGDVLLSIDNIELSSVKQFAAAVAKLDKARPVTVLVRRGDSVNFIIIRPAR